MNRTHRVKVGLSYDKKGSLERLAQERGLTLSSYIRFVLNEYARLCFDIQEIKDNTKYVKERLQYSLRIV